MFEGQYFGIVRTPEITLVNQPNRLPGWLRNELLRRDWNGSDLANRMGVEPSRVSRWIRGKARPSTKSCDVLADVLGVDVDLVLTLTGHRPDDGTTSPDDPGRRIADLALRVPWRPDTAKGVEDMFRAWIVIGETDSSGES